MKVPSDGADGIGTNWRAVAAAALAWWTLPVLVRFSPRNEAASTAITLICLFAFAACLWAFVRFRRSGWIVVIWVPFLVWSGAGALWVLGSAASQPRGGPDAAPLEGVAMALGLAVALVLGGAAVLAWVWRPLVWSAPLMLLAMANTAVVSYATRQANRSATRQDIAMHILEPSGKPIPGASVRWERYGYGRGGTDVLDTSGGPLVSDENGTVVLPSRSMRCKMKGTIAKPGFREVLFTVGMQFSKWDKERDVRISTRETPDIAWASIPTATPVAFSIYLPPEADALQPLRAFNLARKLTGTERLNAYLNVETGKFTDRQSDADLEFEAFFETEGQYNRMRLRVNGINGTTLQIVPFQSDLVGKLSPYENVFLSAPENGYGETALVPINHSPGAQIYIRARDGRFFARAEVGGSGRAAEHSARLYGQLFVNPTGSRLLEGPRR